MKRLLRSFAAAALAGIAATAHCLGREAPPDKEARPLAGAADSLLPAATLQLRLTWGHRSPANRPFHIQCSTREIGLRDLRPIGLEAKDQNEGREFTTRAGGGDVDGLVCRLHFVPSEVDAIDKPQSIWQELFERSDSDTRRRLQAGPGFRPDSRKLTVQCNAEGTRGFSLTVDQIKRIRTFWIPEFDVFVAAGDSPDSFNDHLERLAPSIGRRVLDRVTEEPEATYQDFTARWQDMGHPDYHNPHAAGPGHIVCLTWDSAVEKFGIDRGGNVWPDYGHRGSFYFGLDLGDLQTDISDHWDGQKLSDGLPVITTSLHKDGIIYKWEQFAYPLEGPPAERRGDVAMVLLQKLSLYNPSPHPHAVKVGFNYRRKLASPPGQIRLVRTNHARLWISSASPTALLAMHGDGEIGGFRADFEDSTTTHHFVLDFDIPSEATRDVVLNLPATPVPKTEWPRFAKIDFAAARAETVAFWQNYLDRGAGFHVPEPAVNSLFRANLWHALRLPRRHGGASADTRIDLPYSNFAYDQTGAPWPVNQAVYVDYMIYDLRGYHDLAAEELAAIFRYNQQADGRVAGYANWGVYTPSMIYAVANHYLLSGNRDSFDNLLPATLKALDWCLGEIRKAEARGGLYAGLVFAPLNDLSHENQGWAFNQAYLFAAMDRLATALTEINHPRSSECRAAANAISKAVEQGYGRASVQSSLVPLRDHTWIPYVPGDALRPHRLLKTWYPTDVDTGPLHLSRLRALNPRSDLTTFLLNDHEDNLFLYQWGMANEPVYNQHATAYLHRDQPKPAIRAFYSMLACAFSHTVFEAVEHRWGWGQYFCPPSTDGAWFELYRNLLVQESNKHTLLLAPATPRRWLADGRRIEIENAPTWFGPISMSIDSQAASGKILVHLDPPARKRPDTLIVRLRHPTALPLQAVEINNTNWTDFQPAREWIRIPAPNAHEYEIVARYETAP